MTYNVYTDGSCTKSRSGWGFVVVSDENIELYSSSGKMPTGTTNQACELMAALQACLYVAENYPSNKYNIYSDSAYLVNCYNDRWYVNWENNGWLNSKKEPVANQNLWMPLIEYFEDPNFNFIKVKGHAGNPFNEKADKLATGIIITDAVEPTSWTPMDLTSEKNYGTIKMKLSEILIEFQLNNNYNDSINKIIELFERN